ncbi:Hint domain-containing protein [Ancylobacter sonchi]|uniref:Hint domain-containing protein n=1 Tax=Ancylobacter sonchi TaxID=1937790 RepID=UPI001BD55335|nr:Hint domain-containing protein [Ancylobacter sonchi]MBS7536598.1 Hint domain-containing protein [Ancylobacter sonchi]
MADLSLDYMVRLVGEGDTFETWYNIHYDSTYVTNLNDETQTFAIGDPIYISTQGSEPSLIGYYAGYSDDGIIIQYTSGFYWYATHVDVPSESELTMTRANYTTCFLAGTLIATPDGERPVEELAIGDLLLTASGETRPVRWLGRQTVVSRFADPLANYPIRITAGVLGDDLPLRDLFVSPKHALMLGGILVQAGALVNGVTILRHKPEEIRFTYYHIELEDHALVLAEGVPAETFVNNVTRRRFDNYAEFEALYGEPSDTIAEMDLPRVKSARQLPATIRARIAAQMPSKIVAA